MSLPFSITMSEFGTLKSSLHFRIIKGTIGYFLNVSGTKKNYSKTFSSVVKYDYDIKNNF